MELVKRKALKIAEILESPFLNLPQWYLEKTRGFTNTAKDLCIQIYKYLSTESGRKKLYKEYTINQLRDILRTGENPLARNTVTDAIALLKNHDLFLIREDYIGKEKVYIFYINNSINRKLFKDVEDGHGSFERYFGYFFKPNSKFEIEVQATETKDIPSETSIQSTESDKTPESITNIDFNDVLKSVQESYIQENLNQESYNHELDDFNNLNIDKNNNEMSNHLEDILINYGLTKSKITEFKDMINLDKTIVMDTIAKVDYEKEQGRCKSKTGLLIALLKKELIEKKENISKNTVSDIISKDLRDRFVKYCVSKKVILSISTPNAFNNCCDDFMNLFRNNIDFIKGLKEIISIEDIKEIFDYRLKESTYFKNRFEKYIAEFLFKFENIENLKEDKFDFRKESKQLLDTLKLTVKNISKISLLDRELIPC